MKKKVRRFDVGGDVRERALKFASLAGKPEEQEAYQKAQHARGQAEAEASDRARSAESRADRVMEGLRKESTARTTSAPAPKSAPASEAPRSKYVGSTNDAGEEGAPSKPSAPGKFTDSDAESRAVRRSEADDENVRNIQRARDEADNDAAIKRGQSTSARTFSDKVVEEPDVPHGDTKPANEGRRTIGERIRGALGSGGAGDIRNIAGALAGPGAGRAAQAVGRTVGRAASEASGAAGAQRVIDTAARRAAQNRAEQAATARREETARRAAETRARVQERLAPRRSKLAERRQDARDVERMGGEGPGFKKGGKVSASSRGDGIAQRGKTKGRLL